MKNIILGVLALTLLGLAGCATMNEAECVTADWRGIGYEDGANGRDASYIGNHRSACADYGVTPDLDDYRAGYEEGVAYFCRPENGFNMGRSGRSYSGICPPEQASAFVLAYNEGRELYQISSAINQMTREIDGNQAEVSSMREEISEKEALLVSDDTPSAQRTALLQDIRELEQEIGRLEAETLELERDRAVMNQEYAELEAQYSPF